MGRLDKSALSEKSLDREVIIIQRVLPHYRIEFFTRLSRILASNNIKLKVLYGRESKGTVPKTVNPQEDWAVYIENKYLRFLGYEFVWQKCLSSINKPEIIIIEQANRLLVNYIILILRFLGKIRVAYWGHGRNLQGPKTAYIRNFIKARLIKYVDWWFAYTQISADIIKQSGFPESNITIVDNSIDTESFKKALSSVTLEQIQSQRNNLSIKSRHIGLYCGGMYPEKKLSFLLSAAEKIRAKHDNFHMIFVGSGPQEDLVRKKADNCSWMHYIGPVYGADRAVYFKMCDLMLMPGLVGLAIVDSFIAGLPMITTDVPIHSPEISYLENNVNGVMTPYDIESYVNAVSECLCDENKMKILRSGCSTSATKYTLDRMVNNFANGIISCI